VGPAETSVPAALLAKLKLLPLRERELSTLRQVHQHHLRWIEGAQELMARLTSAGSIPEAVDTLLSSLVREFGFDISFASSSASEIAGDAARELTPADRQFFAQVVDEVKRAGSVVVAKGESIQGERTLAWLMGGVASTAEMEDQPIVVVGRTLRTAPYYPAPEAKEAGLYRHLLSTVAQVFRSIELQATHNSELSRKVRERTAALEEAQRRVLELEREKVAEQMAGGFAHEMRNALSGAKLLLERGMGRASEGERSVIDETANELKRIFLMGREQLDPEAFATLQASIRHIARNERMLDEIIQDLDRAVRRALSITTLIMEYSRVGYSKRGTDLVDLAQLARLVVAESAAQLTQHSVEATVQVEGACVIRGVETHAYSILKNLLLNAYDALLEVDDGRRRQIELRLRRHAHGVEVCVSDNANGIPEAIRSRVFEPFFSTKPQTGTGLGLGMVQKLVALHDGNLELDSEVGLGTEFTLTFPLEIATDNEGHASSDAPLQAEAVCHSKISKS
jgi:signal transduction histidine kinase